jgi:hypothetical protein
VTGPNPNRPLRWMRDNRANLWIAAPDDSAPYRVTYSGWRYIATLGAGTVVGGGDTHVAAQNAAQADYNARRAARQVDATVVPTARLIEAMRAAIDTAYRNLTPPGAITVAVSLEAVAEAVGIDPATLRSETRP